MCVGAMDGPGLGRAVNQVAQGGDFVNHENGNGRGQNGHEKWLQEFHGEGARSGGFRFCPVLFAPSRQGPRLRKFRTNDATLPRVSEDRAEGECGRVEDYNRPRRIAPESQFLAM